MTNNATGILYNNLQWGVKGNFERYACSCTAWYSTKGTKMSINRELGRGKTEVLFFMRETYSSSPVNRATAK